MKMKKIISVCLCICLMSGCGKSLRHGRPVNAVVEDKGSEGVPTHSLTSDTSALTPSNTPTPTPEPSNPALPASGNVDTGSSVVKIVAVILSVIAVYYGVYYYIKRVEANALALAEEKPKRFSVGKEYTKRMEAAGKAFDEGDDAEGYRQLDEANALELDEANALELAGLGLAEGKPKRWRLVVGREYGKRMEAIDKAFDEGDFDEVRRHEFEASQIPAIERYQYISY
jgi:hypothetical protein